MVVAAAAADDGDVGSLRLVREGGQDEAESLGGRMEAPDPEGREEDDDGGSSSSTSSRALSSFRQLSLSSGMSGDPITREWEELPSRELIRQIFGSTNQRTSLYGSTSGPESAESTSQVFSPRPRFQRWLWLRRHRTQRQQQHALVPQMSPLALSAAPAPKANDGGGQPPLPGPSQQMNEELRSHVTETLLFMVHQDLEAKGQAMEDEVNALLALQAVLIQRKQATESALKVFQEEAEGLEKMLRVVLENVHALEEWGRRNGASGRTPVGGEVDVDTVFVPRDGLSAEILDCQSADWAVDDLDYGLEKAVRRGALAAQLYLENGRALARRQFYLRASLKILVAALPVQVLLVRGAEIDEEMGLLAS